VRAINTVEMKKLFLSAFIAAGSLTAAFAGGTFYGPNGYYYNWNSTNLGGGYNFGSGYDNRGGYYNWNSH